MKVIQSATIISEGGRDGSVESPDGGLSIAFNRPGAEAITPEHLFAGAYAACFHSALRSAAESNHVKVAGSTVTSVVHLEETERGAYQLGVELRATLPGVRRDQAEHLMHLAHQSCPYSHATRGNIDVRLAFD